MRRDDAFASCRPSPPCWASPRPRTPRSRRAPSSARSGTRRARPCPGATVTLTDQGKGTSQTVTTDTQGSYIAPFLIPGTYEVAVEMAGFRKYVRRGVVLQVNQRARVDVALELGGLDGVDRGGGARAAHPHRLGGDRRGDRGARGARAAPERPQLRDPRLPRARRHPRPVRREPLGGLDLQPPRRLELQRPRAPRPTRTRGSSTASTTTSTRSTPSSSCPRSSRSASSRC